MAENINNSVTLEKLFNLMNAVPEKKRQDLVNRAYEAIKPRIAEIIEEYKEFYVFFEQLKAFCISTGENYAVSMPNDIDFNKAKSDGEHDEALVVVEEKQKEETAKTEQAPSKDSVEDEKHEDDDTKPENKDNDHEEDLIEKEKQKEETAKTEQDSSENSSEDKKSEGDDTKSENKDNDLEEDLIEKENIHHEPSDGTAANNNENLETDVQHENTSKNTAQKLENFFKLLFKQNPDALQESGLSENEALEFLSSKTTSKVVA